MALPDRDLPPTPERYSAKERERQEALNRSWQAVQRDMADPERWDRIQAAIAEVDARPEPATVTHDELLALVRGDQ